MSNVNISGFLSAASHQESRKFRCKESLKRALELLLQSYLYSQNFCEPDNKPTTQINNWICLTCYISLAEAPFADSAQKHLKNLMTITVSLKSRAARG